VSSTATNKQPLLVDRPLFNSALITNQVVGTSNTVNVQGGQAPKLLVDMDATLSVDINNGGVVESFQIVRYNHERPADYTITAASSGDTISLISGMTVNVENAAVITTGDPSNGAGIYTYTGAGTLTAVNTAIVYSGGLTQGFSFVNSGSVQPAAQFAFYHTRNTVSPVPGDNDYHVVFVATIPQDAEQLDCTKFMPTQDTPVPAQGQVSGMATSEPIRNRGIYLQRGDRVYVGLVANGPFASGTTDVNAGFMITAQGGYY